MQCYDANDNSVWEPLQIDLLNDFGNLVRYRVELVLVVHDKIAMRTHA